MGTTYNEKATLKFELKTGNLKTTLTQVASSTSKLDKNVGRSLLSLGKMYVAFRALTGTARAFASTIDHVGTTLNERFRHRLVDRTHVP